jgi:hypothetical protein
MSDKQETAEYDQKIMDELLAEPGVAEKVAVMTAGELDLYKTLIVNQGIYRRYVYERQKKQLREAFGKVNH